MDKIKKYCFIFLILVLFVPIMQRFIKLHESEPLLGMNAPSQYPVFHYKDWMSGEYQKTSETFVSGNFGYRNFLVRTLNSIDYSIFNTSNTKNVLIGKDKHLFFNYNIEHYLGIRKQKESDIDSLFLMTDTLIAELETRGIEYLFVIAPSNAYYYSDKFPRQYDRYEKRVNDYDYYLKKLEEHNINYIDFNQWFLDIKDTVNIELFPKNGTHYTYSSAVWVADSMLSYMEDLKDIDIPDIITDTYSVDSMREYEHDLLNIMNLGHEVENSDMLYYNLEFDKEGKTAPKVLAVGDSFYWPVINQLIPLNCFSNVSYWFYNQKVFPESFTNEKLPCEVDLDSLFNGLDFIIIYSSATLIKNYDYDGFIDNMLNYFNGDYAVYRKEEKIQSWIDVINSDEKWYNAVKEKAINLNIPIDIQIRTEAEWMVKQNAK